MFFQALSGLRFQAPTGFTLLNDQLNLTGLPLTKAWLPHSRGKPMGVNNMAVDRGPFGKVYALRPCAQTHQV